MNLALASVIKPAIDMAGNWQQEDEHPNESFTVYRRSSKTRFHN